MRISSCGKIGISGISAAMVLSSFCAAHAADGPFTLTILHNNDAESQLINLGGSLSDFGGIARFKGVVDQLRQSATIAGRPAIMLSSGDNFLAGPEFNASLSNGVPFYDTIGMQLIGYDAICIGNHEFDFGPGVLADFIGGFTDGVPFLSANLDVSAESELEALRLAGRIAPSTVLTIDGRKIGIVGATTPSLASISSPGGVIVDPDVVTSVQNEVDALLADDVRIIILISHLQSIGEDLTLIPQLRGVDIVIAGGGDDLLANPADLLVPGDVAVDSYPIEATDADGETVRVVTTKGGYAYVGQLIVSFDRDGRVTSVDPSSGPVRVAGGDEPDAVMPDAAVAAQVTDPVAAAVAGLAANVIAQSDVPLDGRRIRVRASESNYGNMIADAILWQVAELARGTSLPVPHVAMQNGGGIRNDSIVPVGDYTELDTFDALPFTNFVTLVEGVSPAELLAIMESAVSRINPQPGFPTGGDGRFAQIAGMRMVYNEDLLPGARVRSLMLTDGTQIVKGGAPVPGAPSINVATIDFLARGGDEYPFTSSFTVLGVPYQLALRNFVEQELGGIISAAQYPESGEGRIVRLAPDVDGDFTVGLNDLMLTLGAWGPCLGCPEDVNGDGLVDLADILVILETWME